MHVFIVRDGEMERYRFQGEIIEISSDGLGIFADDGGYVFVDD